MPWDFSQPAPSPRELMSVYRAEYESQISTGSIRPVVVPYQLRGFILLFWYLFIPHINRPWLYQVRWPVLALIVALEVQSISETRTLNMATGIAAGLLSAWVIVLAFTWLVFNNPQLDAKRVERRKKTTKVQNDNPIKNEVNGQANGFMNGHTNGYTASGHQKDRRNGVTERGQANGVTHHAKDSTTEWEYFWQPYPSKSARERLSWVLDLIFNWRGSGWNWCIPSIPGQPPHVMLSLGEPVDAASKNNISTTGFRRYDSRSAYYSAQLPKLFLGYFLLDLWKTIMMKDPYFLLGPNDYPPPQYLASLSPFLLGLYRRQLSLFAVITSLQMAFALSPIVLFAMLGTRIIGLRGEPWMYPTTWGTFSNIYNKGIGGLWAGWWHQVFRLGFAAPTNYLVNQKIIPPKSQLTKITGLFFAFAVSAFLHACGTSTTFPPTKPQNAILFFVIQIPAIIVQTALSKYFKWLPRPVRQVGNVVVTFIWMNATGHLLIDDFARGGVWLYEPIPISPLRALGFGNEGDWWYCWDVFGIGWHQGRHWWESGISS